MEETAEEEGKEGRSERVIKLSSRALPVVQSGEGVFRGKALFLEANALSQPGTMGLC